MATIVNSRVSRSFFILGRASVVMSICLSIGFMASDARAEDPPAPTCSKPINPEAMKRYLNCVHKIQVNVGKGLIVDADSNLAWLVDARTGRDPICYSIGIGRPSRGGSGAAQLSNVNNSNMTPPGLLVTFHKTDTVGPFGSFNDFVGLTGTNEGNKLTAYPRGILLHDCGWRQDTSGCICFKGGRPVWSAMKAFMMSQDAEVGTPVYVYSRTMTGDGCADGTMDTVQPARSSWFPFNWGHQHNSAR